MPHWLAEVVTDFDTERAISLDNFLFEYYQEQFLGSGIAGSRSF